MAERSLSTEDAGRAAAWLRDLDRVLSVAEEEEALPEGAARLLAERVEARATRDWGTSDRLRDELVARYGVIVEDTRDGQRWRRAVEVGDG